MSGLRQRKKDLTSDRIVEAASRLFQNSRYETTTVDMIASDADVSAGTVYNYFGTKSAILTAVVTRDTSAAMESASSALDLAADHPVDALMPVVKVYVDVTLGLGAEVLRELFKTVLNPSHAGLTQDIMTMDERAIAELGVALAKLESVGMVDSDVDPMEAALVLYSVIAAAIIVYMTVPEVSPDDVMSLIRRQVELVFEGIGASGPFAGEGFATQRDVTPEP